MFSEKPLEITTGNSLFIRIILQTQRILSPFSTVMPPSRTFSLDKRIFNSVLYSKLLKIWFDGLPAGASAPTEQLVKRWFGIGADESEKASFDLGCRSEFHEALSSISPTRFPLPTFSDMETDTSHYPDIAAPFLEQFHHDGFGDPDAALGLTLLLDQIPRNIFRKDQALIYGHYDRIARAVFYAIHKHNLDQHERYFWSPPYRQWFYMPLMHSESLADHQLLKQTLEDLKLKLEMKGEDVSAQAVGQVISFDERHLDLLQKFGRYPYRNQWLGRETNNEERKWLEEGGETFGS
jgi:uncharacterized protein (DUF924 family)